MRDALPRSLDVAQWEPGEYAGQWGTIDAPSAFSRALLKWCRDAKVPKITPHQLRYSCATNLARCGMPLHLIQSVMNHQSITTTQRYVKATNVEVVEWARLRKRYGPHG